MRSLSLTSCVNVEERLPLLHSPYLAGSNTAV